jgi:hypothetical protein
MQWTKDMLVALSYGLHEEYRAYRVASLHPDGVMLIDDEKSPPQQLALTTAEFEKRKPFPVGYAVKSWWHGYAWRFGQSKPVG